MRCSDFGFVAATAFPRAYHPAARARRADIETPPPAWTELVLFAHGYARIVLHNASALEWIFIEDVAGKVEDRFWILK